MPESLSEMLQNPKGMALRNFMAQILGQKYLEYEELLHRATFFLITDKDAASFSKMINDVYELGYIKAVSDYKEQLNNLGIKVNVTQKTSVGSQKL
jgi:hypothetical protein